jgi:hypothetical protein
MRTLARGRRWRELRADMATSSVVKRHPIVTFFVLAYALTWPVIPLVSVSPLLGIPVLFWPALAASLILGVLWAAFGYLTARVLEPAIIMVGVFSLISVVTLRQDFTGTAGADVALLVTTSKSLVALHDWTFLFGPGVLAGVGNGMLLGYLMYR